MSVPGAEVALLVGWCADCPSCGSCTAMSATQHDSCMQQMACWCKTHHMVKLAAISCSGHRMQRVGVKHMCIDQAPVAAAQLAVFHKIHDTMVRTSVR